jgi:hypothetical protein
MIRGNEKAIDLTLAIMESVATKGSNFSLDAFVAICAEARKIIGGAPKPVTKQDFWYLEHRAIWKLQKAAFKRAEILRSEVHQVWDGKNYRGVK